MLRGGIASGGNPELVGDQVNGALFEAGNVEELSRKLVHLSQDSGGRSRWLLLRRSISTTDGRTVMLEAAETMQETDESSRRVLPAALSFTLLVALAVQRGWSSPSLL